MKNIFPAIAIILCILLNGCKTIAVGNKALTVIEEPISLGGIIDFESTVSKNLINVRTVPNYKNRIKLSAFSIEFNKKAFKNYKNAVANQSIVSQDSTLKDSVQSISNYIYLSIQDKLDLIEAINGEENSNVVAYLKLNHKSKVVDEIAVVFSDEETRSIQKAEEVFLYKMGIDSYGLHLYTDSKLTSTVLFNNAVVFAFSASFFCWQGERESDLKIVDLSDARHPCPENTYSKARKAIKKVDLYDF
ncbi:hypothetical protein [Nonlabens agnitus]|uniref:Uncharacterized protein n=1 Tax=Nonlabens agnitus TaxID=870484 RepID=A0A2S9WQV6_9FLAO|nr:hypothetical protein [Nonlabens agnitus]PRP65875.1 hypothetical protein BST86_01610 [Nonlabens agnitus]